MPDSWTNEKTGEMKVSCHSRYDPEAEARKHLEASLAGKKPALVFILGAGRNYLGQELRQTLPGVAIIVLQASTDFDSCLVDPGDLYWSPGSPYALEIILTSALASGKAAGGVAIIEWPPAVRTCGIILESIRKTLSQMLERYSAESATTGYWGKKWLKNCVDFACGEGPLTLPGRASGPLVIACAGPGLHDTIPAIKEAGTSVRLWALASAHQALMNEDLYPELLISTDPGFWNGAHLVVAARQKTILAATPSTRLGSSILDGRTAIAPVYTGLGFELDALASAGDIPAITALPSGTAAGTALSIATTLGAYPIILCGLDLAARGLSEHSAPYTFDLLDETMATHLKPALTTRFHRVMDRYPEAIGNWRLSRAFSAYAMDTASLTGRDDIFRISNSPVETSLKCVSPDFIRSALSPALLKPKCKTPTASSDAQIFFRKLTRKARRESMIERLERRAELALAVLYKNVAISLPVPRDTVLELLAFGGKGCAPAIARAARGEASNADIQDAKKAVGYGLRQLAGGRA